MNDKPNWRPCIRPAGVEFRPWHRSTGKCLRRCLGGIPAPVISRRFQAGEDGRFDARVVQQRPLGDRWPSRLAVPAGHDHADDQENDQHQDRACDDDHRGIESDLLAATNEASEPNATPTTGTITIIASAWVRPSPTA